MSLRKSDQRVTVAEYLEMEMTAAVRHEYVRGYVYAMAGASDRHNLIAGTLYSRLLATSSSLGCQAFISDMKLMCDVCVFYYPDVMVCCEATDNDPYTRKKPVLTIEVTSPGTERVDHHEKLLAYKNIDTLVEYALVAQDRLQVEVHRRKDGRWQQPEFLSEAGEVLRLESVGLDLTMGEIYSNVRLGQGG